MQACVFQASIAFPAQTVMSWSHRREEMTIEPKSFGGNCQGNYVPLKPTVEGAVKAALEAEQNSFVAAKAATEPTEWCVLTLTLTPNEVMEAFTKGFLHWSAHMRGFEWWRTLQPTETGRLDWSLHVLDPIGLHSWAYTTCHKKFQRPQFQGHCGGCGAGSDLVQGDQGVPLWKATREYLHMGYCAICWRDFVSSKEQDPHGSTPESLI